MQTRPGIGDFSARRLRGIKIHPSAQMRIIVLSAPLLFAIMSWDLSQSAGNVSILKFFSVPVLFAEFLVVLCAHASGFGFRDLWALLPRRAALGAAALFLLAGASLLRPGPGTIIGLLELASWCLHGLFGLSCYAILTRSAGASGETDRQLWAGIAAALLPFCVLVIAFAVRALSVPDFDWGHFGLASTNVRHLGYYSLVGATLSIGLAVTAGGRCQMMLWILAAGILLGLSIWSGSRGPLAAFAMSLVAGAMLLRRARRLRLFAIAAGGVLVAVPIAAIWTPPAPQYGLARIVGSIGPERQQSVDALSSGRVTLWKRSGEAIAKRPLFGHGQGRFRRALADNAFNHPHNVMLQTAFQWGAVGAALFLALLLWALTKAGKAAWKSGERALPPIMMIAGLLTMSLYDGAMFYPYPLMMLVLGMTALIARDALGLSG